MCIVFVRQSNLILNSAVKTLGGEKMTKDFQENHFEEDIPYFLGGDEPFENGTAIQTFNITEITPIQEGYEVLLDFEIDSGYEFKGAKMVLTHEDMQAYETEDVHTACKYAFGFFD